MIAVLFALLGLAGLVILAVFAASKISSKDELAADGNHEGAAGGENRLQRAGLRRRRGGPRRRGQDEGVDEEEQEAQDEVKPVSRKDAYEARRAAKDAEREAQEKAQEEAMLRAAQEREAREQEEAEKWMHMFSVQDAGEDAISRDQGEELMKNMVEYIKTKKMVPLEDIAAHFGIRTAEVIEKVRLLESDRKITGIMDDRGKYIYISDEEMKKVAEYIRKKGRIAISELSKDSATMIHFDSTAEEAQTVELDDLL